MPTHPLSSQFLFALITLTCLQADEGKALRDASTPVPKPGSEFGTELKTEALKVGTTMDVAVNPTLTVNAAYWAGKKMSGEKWKGRSLISCRPCYCLSLLAALLLAPLANLHGDQQGEHVTKEQPTP